MKRQDVPTAPLTARQLRVLELIADGLTLNEIAPEIPCAAITVKRRRAEIFERLGARNAAHAVHIAHQRGLIGTPTTDHTTIGSTS